MRSTLSICSLLSYLVLSNGAVVKVAPVVNLGTAITFGALSGTAGLTSIGATSIKGNLGTTGVSITGFPPGTFSGTEHIGDPTATSAFTASKAAYAAAKALKFTKDLTVTGTLGGLTLAPGVYKFTTTAALAGTVTLSGAGNYVFQIGSTLTTSNGSSVVLANGATACNVFWQVGTSATIASNVKFVGSLLSMVSITLATGSSVSGGLFSDTASITLVDNAITVPVC